MDIESYFGGGNSQDETADEEHDHRVGEAGHHLLVAEKLADGGRIADPFDAGIGGEQEQQDHDAHRCCPGGNQLEHPHQRCIDEDGDNPLLHLGKAVDSEAFRRQEPKDEDDDGDKKEADAFLLQYVGVESVALTQLVHLGNQTKTSEILEHGIDSIALTDYSYVKRMSTGIPAFSRTRLSDRLSGPATPYLAKEAWAASMSPWAWMSSILAPRVSRACQVLS